MRLAPGSRSHSKVRLDSRDRKWGLGQGTTPTSIPDQKEPSRNLRSRHLNRQSTADAWKGKREGRPVARPNGCFRRWIQRLSIRALAKDTSDNAPTGNSGRAKSRSSCEWTLTINRSRRLFVVFPTRAVSAVPSTSGSPASHRCHGLPVAARATRSLPTTPLQTGSTAIRTPARSSERGATSGRLLRGQTVSRRLSVSPTLPSGQPTCISTPASPPSDFALPLPVRFPSWIISNRCRSEYSGRGARGLLLAEQPRSRPLSSHPAGRVMPAVPKYPR